MNEPAYLPNRRILNRRILRFGGCGSCPQVDQDCQQSLTVTRCWLRHTGRQCWDNWGHIVLVFRPGELVEVELTHDDQMIYCASATSTLFPGVRDFIDLANFSEV